MRILVVEDEIDLLEAICEGLRMDGYAVDACDNGEEAYELLSVEEYDLAILDLNLPGMDGLSILSYIRQEKPALMILILSARNSVVDKVKGLDLGANDYLAKPFDFIELEARIRNLLRRKYAQPSNVISYDIMQIDLFMRTAMIEDTILPLTKKEFSLLEYFLLNPHRAIPSEELIEHIWDARSDCFSGAIRVHISSLRKKLKCALGYDPIENKVKEGYRLVVRGGVRNV